MKLIRSWPATVPPGRSYVYDDLERLHMLNHDYCVLDAIDDDVVLLEWDMAVGQEELKSFIGRAQAARDTVLVAPYRLYVAASGAPYDRPTWALRRFTHNGTMARFCVEADVTAHMFGFGLIYLPRLLVQRFLAEYDGPFTDATFSQWHYLHGLAPEVPIAWDVRPVHVHYDISTIAKGLA